MCAENTAQGGHIERFVQHEVLAECCMILDQNAVFFIHTSGGSALSDILYILSGV